MRSAVLDAALTYASAGFPVFPVWYASVYDSGNTPGTCGCGKSDCLAPAKHPLEWLVKRGKDDASLDPATIRRWFEIAPQANLGLVTAESGLVVLDVDISHGKHGRESLAEIDAELSQTRTAITGSGGIHAYYLRPPDLEPFSRIGPRPGIDLIGNGYVIAPPSIHISGRPYKWLNDLPMVQLPSVLRHLKKPIVDKIAQSEVGTVPVVEGGRNNAMFRLGAALRAAGIDIQALRAALHLENRRRFQPPLSDAEVDEVAVKVMRHARVDRDVAISAVVESDLRDLVGTSQETRTLWTRDVASTRSIVPNFYPTDNTQLDALLGGGIASRMVTGIIGPPSMGKSAYVGQLCLTLQRQLPVLHISTELQRDELTKRYGAQVKGWVWRDAIKGLHDDDLLDAVRDLRVKLTGTDQLDFADPVGFIVKEALAIRDETGQMPAIALDYVQQLARGSEDGIRGRVGELTLKLRKASQILDTPILAVFTTGREYYSGANIEKLRLANDPIGYLRAAKESGDIEYDCGNLIYLDVDQGAEGQPKPARAVVARARMGSPGFAGYRAHLDVGRWVPDPLAVTEFVTGGSRQQETRRAGLSLDDELVLQTVRNHPDQTWREIRDLCGISQVRATAAKLRLLSSGALVDVAIDTWGIDARKLTRHVLSLGLGNKKVE